MTLADLDITTDPLARLAADHAAGVFRYLRSVLQDQEIARDLLQEVFVKLQPRAAEAGKGLVFTVARSCALDHLRRRKVRRQHLSSVPEFEDLGTPAAESTRPDRALETKQLRNDLLDGLARLSEEQRTVFHLSEIEDLSYEQIARVLNVKPGTIASRKHHAVIKLREYLRRRGHGA